MQHQRIEKTAQEVEYFDCLINEHQAAQFVGYTVRALQNWRVRGGGPSFVKISARSVRYRRRDLMAWAEAHLRTSTSQEVAA
jgi:predicted DNA-binding transcriptional regulator AlpA